ncbi:unnamed protein product [Clonostachys byssicola]|uniref:Zn(2)-C6 fungal-type domain-containing protein n=1 Tax=Clonostachys byssicola TaxID=160290 RepID=A0A9N9URJ7_9HYPO|nr:unnamed protein product [Clonostachys byssicola]
MVGVRGRSKACSTCRRRKKGCDLQQPSCGQCRKAAIPCGGYADSFVIHQYQGAGSGTTTDKPSDAGPSSQTSPPDWGIAAQGLEFVEWGAPVLAQKWVVPKYLQPPNADEEDAADPKARGRASRRPSPRRQDSPGPARFGWAASEAGLIGAFFDAYYPNRRCGPATTELQRTLGGSIILLQDYAPTDPVLRQALLATALRTLGRRPDAPAWLEKRGMVVYSSALQEMAAALQSPKRRQSLDILGAVRTFSIHEALFGSDANPNGLSQRQSWMAHNAGDIALILNNPPSYYIDGLAHRLFVDGRLHLVLTAFQMKKKIFLAQSEWLTIPWTKHAKTPRDFLIDILIGVMEVFVDIYAMQDANDEKEKQLYRDIIKGTVSYLSTALIKWLDKYAVPTIPSKMGADLPEYITTEDIANGHVMTIFWGNCCLIDQIKRMAFGENNSPSSSPHGWGPHDDEDIDPLDPANACHHILRVVPIFLHPSAGIFRQHLMPFVLGAAAFYLTSAGPMRMRIERAAMMDYLARPESASLAKFLSSIQKQTFDDLRRQAGPHEASMYENT